LGTEPKTIEPYLSLFDEILLDVGYKSTFSLSPTHTIRRLVLARNVAAINSLLQETIQLTGDASIGVTKIADFNFDTFEQRAWVDEWRGDFFRQLWVLREDLEFQGYKLQQNLRVVNRIAATIREESREPKSSGVGSNLSSFQQLEEQEKDDKWEWEDFERQRLYAFRIMERTTDSYLQTVQATGAQFANLQSRRFEFYVDQLPYHKLTDVIVSGD